MMGKGGYCSEMELVNINIIILQLDQEGLDYCLIWYLHYNDYY